jgi:hypothetical protein
MDLDNVQMVQNGPVISGRLNGGGTLDEVPVMEVDGDYYLVDPRFMYRSGLTNIFKNPKTLENGDMEVDIVDTIDEVEPDVEDVILTTSELTGLSVGELLEDFVIQLVEIIFSSE